MNKLFTLLYVVSIGTVCATDPMLEVQINSKPVQQAIQEKLLTPIFDHILKAEKIIIKEGVEPAYEEVLSCVTYSTPSQMSLVKVSTVQEGNKRDFSFQHVGGNPRLSHVVTDSDEGQIRLHHDVVTKQLLDDPTFLSGMRVARVTGGWEVNINTGTGVNIANAVISSRGPIKLQSIEMNLEAGCWFRTPTGVRFSPLEGVLSAIKEIDIIPRLFIYDQGGLAQSWTTYIKGKVDFVNSIINLEVHNATVEVSFNKNILPDGINALNK